MDKINELTKKAEFLRVVEDIQTKIQHYGLTATDLGFEINPGIKKVYTSRKPSVKYKEPISGNGMSKEQFVIS